MTHIADDIRRITSGPVRSRLRPEISPSATRSIAGKIARAVLELNGGIGAVACWTNPENLIVAFAVAEALDTPAVQLSEDEGLLYFSWELPTARIVLVAAAGESAQQIDVAAQMLAGAGHECVAVVELAPADGDQDGTLTVRTLPGTQR
ncbi:hypothetical protein [Microbacterium gubbeenense]|uniref:hypothetical protein n=1 Tax=Microbacterium gubbeenense TaxID=159896 RepID=UPI00041A8F7E|nr:hypothetical protein [Microbacterium gubbeenense]